MAFRTVPWAVVALALVAGVLPFCGTETARPAAPPTREGARVDFHGDPLPPGAVARLGSMRWRQSGGVSEVAWDHDGRKIISTNGGEVRVWDTATGRPLSSLKLHVRGLEASLSRDRTRIAGTSLPPKVGVWNLRSGEPLWQVKVTDFPNAMALSPDGLLLALALPDDAVRIHDGRTGKELRLLGRTEWPVRALAFAPDSVLLSVWQENDTEDADGMARRRVSVWDTKAGKKRFRLPEQKGGAPPPQFTTDGKHLAVASESELRLWGSASGRPSAPLPDRAQYAFALSADCKLLATSDFEGVRVWDLPARKQLFQVRRKGPVTSLAFSPDGTKLAAGGSGHNQPLSLWEVPTGRDPRRWQGHTGTIAASALAPDGKVFATGGGDGTVRLWDLQTGRELRALSLGSMVRGLAYSPDGKSLAVVAGSRREEPRPTVRLFDPRTGKEALGLDAPAFWPMQVVFSPDGSALAGIDSEKGLRLWDLRNRELLPTPPGAGTRLRHIAFADATSLAVAGLEFRPAKVSRGQVWMPLRFWDWRTGKLLGELSGPSRSVGGGPAWREGAGKGRGGPGGLSGGASGFAYSHDRRVLAVGGFNALDVRDVTTGRIRRTVRDTFLSNIRCLAVSADGRLVATIDEHGGRPIVWEVATGTSVCSFGLGHLGELTGITFHPDGRLISTSSDASVLVWDLWEPQNLTRAGHTPWSEPRDEVVRLWSQLESPNATGYRALCWLAHYPHEAVSMLTERLRPVPCQDEVRIRQLVVQLSADGFAEREEAQRELGALGHLVEPELLAMLKSPSPEVRRRATTLLDAIPAATLKPALVRQFRAVQLLEHLATPNARALLTRLAGGCPRATLTLEARNSLRRMGPARP